MCKQPSLPLTEVTAVANGVPRVPGLSAALLHPFAGRNASCQDRLVLKWFRDSPFVGFCRWFPLKLPLSEVPTREIIVGSLHTIAATLYKSASIQGYFGSLGPPVERLE